VLIHIQLEGTELVAAQIPAELSSPLDIDIADHDRADGGTLNQFPYRYLSHAATAAECQNFHL
jgi:hypothetical protein